MREELLELQDFIAGIDLLCGPSSNTGYIKVLIKEISPIRLKMEPDPNHHRPHIHLSVGNQYHCASYAVDDGSIIVGQSSRYDKTIAEWIARNKDKLMELWKTLKAGEPYEEIVEVLKQS